MKETKCDGLQATLVKRAAEKNYKAVLFAILNAQETLDVAREVLKTKISSMRTGTAEFLKL